MTLELLVRTGFQVMAVRMLDIVSVVQVGLVAVNKVRHGEVNSVGSRDKVDGFQ